MRIKNEGLVQKVLSEFGLELPAEFELPDGSLQKAVAEVEQQQKHVSFERRCAIAIARTAFQVYGKQTAPEQSEPAAASFPEEPPKVEPLNVIEPKTPSTFWLWTWRIAIAGLLLLIFLFGVPSRGEGQELILQGKDEGTLIFSKGGGKVIFNCVGSGIVCAYAAQTFTLTVAGGGGADHNLLSATHLDTVIASPVLGDLLFANVTPAWTKLAGNTTTTKNFLTQTGSGAVSAAPAWGTIADGDVPAALTRDTEVNVQGTANEIASSGSGVAPTLSLPASINVASKEFLGAVPFQLEGLTNDNIYTTVVVTDPTLARTFTIPNANSVAVQPDTGAANNFLTAISTLGVISKAQVDFSNLSGSATDGQIPNDIAIDLATLATTATTANAGDSATAFFSTGTLETGLLPLPTASTIGAIKSLTCSGTDKLSAIGTDGLPVCSTDQTGGAGGDAITVNTTAVVDPDFIDSTTISVDENLVPTPDTIAWNIVANSINATHIDETTAYAFSSATNTFLAASFTGPTADPADAGVLRLSNSEQICWEASPAGVDFCITGDSAGRIAATTFVGALVGNADTASTASAGDSATAFFASGTLEDARLSTNVALYNNGTKTWGAGAGLNWTFDAGATDPVFEFTSGNVKFSGATTYTYEGGATDPVWTPGNNFLNLSTGTLQQGGTAVSLSGHTHGASTLDTGSVGADELVDAYQEDSKGFVIFDPTTADTNDIQIEFPNAITITEVVCSTDTGTVDIQLDERARATPNTAGTNVMTSTLVCDNNSQATTTFTNATIAADVPLNLQILAVASAPTVVRITVQYRID